MKNKTFQVKLWLLAVFSVILIVPFNGVCGEKVIKWKLQTVDDPGLMEYKAISVSFADRVRELSNGRLDIQVFPPGGLVPSFEVWDALRKNMIQISQHYLVYWSGKDAALKASNELAVITDPLQGMIWMYQAGGLDIVRKMTAKHGVFFLGATPMAGENIWSKKPLNSIDDLKGLKMRAGGLAADTFAALGASIVTVPGGEIYAALERGVIDAAEFTTPTVNYGYGFQEVAKYIVQPQYTAGNYYEWIVNGKAWVCKPELFNPFMKHPLYFLLHPFDRMETHLSFKGIGCVTKNTIIGTSPGSEHNRLFHF